MFEQSNTLVHYQMQQKLNLLHRNNALHFKVPILCFIHCFIWFYVENNLSGFACPFMSASRELYQERAVLASESLRLIDVSEPLF